MPQTTAGGTVSATDQGWEIYTGVECVECPACGFTFDRDHSDADPDETHSCPQCAQIALAARLSAVEQEGEEMAASWELTAERELSRARTLPMDSASEARVKAAVYRTCANEFRALAAAPSTDERKVKS